MCLPLWYQKDHRPELRRKRQEENEDKNQNKKLQQSKNVNYQGAGGC